jgi:ABC-type lipoprotein release transport system permease subunit
MYKLTLCLKYLVKRALAYFAMAAVALCVFLMLVCVSVLSGFVDKIEVAAKGLFGDVVISSASLSGLGEYDELIARIKKDVPEVEDASPFILTFGILQLPGNDFRRTVQLAGIRLPERARVSDFEKGLFVQEGVANPTFGPPEPLILRRLDEDNKRTFEILKRVAEPPPGGKLTPDRQALAERLYNATVFQDQAIDNVRNAAQTARLAEDLQGQIRAADEAGEDSKRDLLERQKAAVEGRMILPPARRVILGLGIAGLSFRTPKGEIIRVIGPGQQIVLSMIPLGRQLSYANITPVTRNFTVIDDCSTDVSSIDSEIVYVPFETLQELSNMGAQRAAGDANVIVEPARCSQIHVKLKKYVPPRAINPGGFALYVGVVALGMLLVVIVAGFITFWLVRKPVRFAPSRTVIVAVISILFYMLVGRFLVRYATPLIFLDQTSLSRAESLRRVNDVARQIDAVWAVFQKTHPDAARSSVAVETWRQRQSLLISSMENQRTLMILILGIISTVAILLIFVILYVIVVQKTRDIGVLKAVGASNLGVAGIFLAYGGAIGMIGSILGTVAGCALVWNINAVHDWIANVTGFTPWNRETFMFEKIPDQVDFATAVWIVCGAVVAGIVGSLLPAVIAAMRQPVEALRYE